MADIFGGGGNGPLIAGGLDIQTSTNVLPVPICWGTNILSGNLTWADGFRYNPNAGGKGFGGKGGNANYTASLMVSLCRGITSGMPLIFEGSQTENNQPSAFSWFASNSVTFVNGSQPDQTAWSGYGSGNPYGNFQYANLNYPSISAWFAPNFNLGGSPTPPNGNYVIQCDPAKFAPYSKVPIGVVGTNNNNGVEVYDPSDADPALVVDDLINGNLNYGRGFPGLTLDLTTCLTSDAIDPTNDSTLQTWCYTNSISFSPFLRQVAKGGAVMDDWALLLNFEVGYWDGMLKTLPRGDTVSIGNGLTFTPNQTPVVQLTVDDFITNDTEMPVIITRKAPEDVPNVVRMEITQCRGIGYSPIPIEARNEVDFTLSGNILRVMPTIQAHSVIDNNVGIFLAQLVLQKQQNIRNTFTFKLGPALGSLLTGMDLVGLTDAASGLNQYVVRINKDGVVSDEHGIVTITAEDYLQGSSSAALYQPGATASLPVNTGIVPDPVNTPIIYEPPSSLASPAMIYFWLSGGFGNEVDPNWGSAKILASVAGSSYAQVGQTAAGPSAQGVLTANLATYSGANPDTTNTLSVDINQCGRQLTTFPTASAAAGASVCYVDGELIGYTTATLTSITRTFSEYWAVPQTPGPYTVTVNLAANYVANTSVTYTGGATLTLVGSSPTTGQYTEAAGVYGFAPGDQGAAITITYTATAAGYNLTGLYRGLYGTTIGAHSSGTQFGFLDNDAAVTKVAVPAAWIGQTVSFKFPSNNFYGVGEQDVSTLPAYTYAIAGLGYGTGTAGVPATPTGLTATAGNLSAILAWSANSSNDNVTDYLLYRAPGLSASFGSAALIWTGTTLGYTDSGLGTNAPYTYFLIAQNAVGKSGNTAGVNLTTGTGVIPTAPLLPTTDTLAAGNFVNIYSSSGVATVRLADASLGQMANGYVLSSAAIGTSATVYFQGVNTALSGLTPGASYWLGNTGQIVAPPASTSGYLIQALGVALSATSLEFQMQGVETA